MAPSANGYGTVSHAASRNTNGSIDENGPLLGGNNNKPEKPSLANRIYNHNAANVDRKWGDVALLLCYIITGLLDSCSVFIWGSFVSMQTGMSLSIQAIQRRPN